MCSSDLSADLPKLRDEEDRRPAELQGGPNDDGEGERVVVRGDAERAGDEAGGVVREVGSVVGKVCARGSVSELRSDEGATERTGDREADEEDQGEDEGSDEDEELAVVVHADCVQGRQSARPSSFRKLN